MSVHKLGPEKASGLLNIHFGICILGKAECCPKNKFHQFILSKKQMEGWHMQKLETSHDFLLFKVHKTKAGHLIL